jgi:hypothetical protein
VIKLSIPKEEEMEQLDTKTQRKLFEATDKKDALSLASCSKRLRESILLVENFTCYIKCCDALCEREDVCSYRFDQINITCTNKYCKKFLSDENLQKMQAIISNKKMNFDDHGICLVYLSSVKEKWREGINKMLYSIPIKINTFKMVMDSENGTYIHNVLTYDASSNFYLQTHIDANTIIFFEGYTLRYLFMLKKLGLNRMDFKRYGINIQYFIEHCKQLENLTVSDLDIFMPKWLSLPHLCHIELEDLICTEGDSVMVEDWMLHSRPSKRITFICKSMKKHNSVFENLQITNVLSSPISNIKLYSYMGHCSAEFGVASFYLYEFPRHIAKRRNITKCYSNIKKIAYNGDDIVLIEFQR